MAGGEGVEREVLDPPEGNLRGVDSRKGQT